MPPQKRVRDERGPIISAALLSLRSCLKRPRSFFVPPLFLHSLLVSGRRRTSGSEHDDFSLCLCVWRYNSNVRDVALFLPVGERVWRNVLRRCCCCSSWAASLQKRRHCIILGGEFCCYADAAAALQTNNSRSHFR